MHLVVTSPPYWNLREYLAADDPMKAFELGSEATPEEYIANQIEVFSEVRRVLRDDGVLFVNIGDSYASASKDRTIEQATAMSTLNGSARNQLSILKQKSKIRGGLKPLDRCGIPERFALAMQASGWFWRDIIIWEKPSPMPMSLGGWQFERCQVKVAASKRSDEKKAESSNGKPHGARGDDGKSFASSAGWTDCPGCAKCTPNGGYVLSRGSWRTTPNWEPIYMFTKSAKYFCDGIGAREPAATGTVERNKYTRVLDDPEEQFAVKHNHEFEGLTRNPRSIWRIPSGGSSLKHFAMFPRELAERCIAVATPAHGVCAKCGAPWARMVKTTKTGAWHDHENNSTQGAKQDGKGPASEWKPAETLGWRATCSCGTDERVGALVLDCYGGSGTTAEAALMMGRRAILCELNGEYIDVIRERIDAACPLLAQEAI